MKHPSKLAVVLQEAFGGESENWKFLPTTNKSREDEKKHKQQDFFFPNSSPKIQIQTVFCAGHGEFE